MNTLISEIRKNKLVDEKRINAFERINNRIKIVKNQLDLLYGNPMRFSDKIEKLESQLTILNV